MAPALEVVPWTRRVRSTALLLVLIGVIGALTAVVIGTAIVVGASLLDSAL